MSTMQARAEAMARRKAALAQAKETAPAPVMHSTFFVPPERPVVAPIDLEATRRIKMLESRVAELEQELQNSANLIADLESRLAKHVAAQSAELWDQAFYHDGGRITVKQIIAAVSSHYKIPVSTLLSPTRAQRVVRPRQVGFFLARELTLQGLPEIGRRFGGRDHTTVMHGVKRVTELIETDVDLAADVDAIRGLLGVGEESTRGTR